MKLHPDNLIDILVRPFQLRFPDEDEHAFRTAQNLEMREHLIYVLTGLLLFGFFLVFSGAGAISPATLWFGIALVSVGLLAVMVPGDARHSQMLVAGGSAVIQLAIMWEVFDTRTPQVRTAFYNLLVPCILAHYMVLRLRFIPALISGVIVFFGLVFILALKQLPSAEVAVYAALTCNVLGLFGAQRLEVMQRVNFMAIRDISDEQKKTQRLVQKMIPKNLADRILAASVHERIDYFDKVQSCSILFVELSDCTQADKRSLFRIFDSIIGRATLEKIKTAENLLIVAGGLFDNNPAAEEILNVAIRMRQEVTQYNLDHASAVGFRAGIASGSASCGIVGAKVFAFDVWGVPVNQASRILHKASVGSICVSEHFLALLHKCYVFQSFGIHELKGLGQQEIFEFEKMSFAARFSGEEAA